MRMRMNSTPTPEWNIRKLLSTIVEQDNLKCLDIRGRIIDENENEQYTNTGMEHFPFFVDQVKERVYNLVEAYFDIWDDEEIGSETDVEFRELYYYLELNLRGRGKIVDNTATNRDWYAAVALDVSDRMSVPDFVNPQSFGGRDHLTTIFDLIQANPSNFIANVNML